MKFLAQPTVLQRRLSCLWFQLFWIESHPFLPNSQCNRANLARQREARHRRLHSLAQQTFIELAEWSGTSGGLLGGAFENVLQIMVVVLIQAAQLLRFSGMEQLSIHVAILPAIVSFERQAAVGPQLPLGSEAMRCLDERE